MGLTIEQALQKGIAAHKAGKLEEAERLYRDILQNRPLHPDANHNLGLLAVALNQVDAALPLFKKALEVNPKIEQFWLSYIDALIQDKQFDHAQHILEQGKRQGLARNKADAIDAQIIRAQAKEPKLGLQKNTLTLSEKRKKLAQRKKQKKDKKQKLQAISPPDTQINHLLEYYQNGQYEEAEELAKSITRQYPTHQFAWKALGAVRKKTNRLTESLAAFRKSALLAPHDAEAHSNLGITLQELGRLDEALASHKKAVALSPKLAEPRNNLGATLKKLGILDEAEASFIQAIVLKPNYAEAHGNLGFTLLEQGRLDDAEASLKQAITFNPGYFEAHCNLGNTLKELERLDEAEASYTQAIELKPDYADAHYNLGITLKELGRLDEAVASYTQAIAIQPDLAEAHSNLGVIFQELGTLDKSVASLRQATVLKPDDAEAYANLGFTLLELGRIDEAETSYAKAIALRPDLASAHAGLSIILYLQDNRDLALKSILKANGIRPKSKDYELLLSVMEARKSREDNKSTVRDTKNISPLGGQASNPLILNRAVEPELITSLYEMDFIPLDKTKRVGLLASGNTDARYGNGIVSPDFNLFKNSRPIIQKLAKDLREIMTNALGSDVYIYDSFFNILSAGGGTTPHAHLSTLDRITGFDIGTQKYSLVYYLSVGDQNCREPGILKLYKPDQDILPCEGMITIIPASREHSAVYSGKTDRIMIGINFYSL